MEFDRERYSVWTWKSPQILFCMLNPLMAFNELALGQRLPSVTLVDRTSPKPFVERQHIPCPACGAHNHAISYTKVALGNYAGLVCAECGEQIPTLKSPLTSLVLMVTWPLWKPLERRFGPGMRARQFAKLQEAKANIPSLIKRASGLRMGLYFGTAMSTCFVVMRLLEGQPWAVAIKTGLFSGILAGIMFGVLMHISLSKRGRGASDQADSG